MQKFTTFLMFSGRAEEAMNFYVSLFEGSRIVEMKKHGPGGHGAEGSVLHATFSLGDQEFMAIDSAGHGFGFTPAVSIFVRCASVEELDRAFAALSEGGKVLMAAGKYPFAERFGWTDDRFGVSWQLRLG